MLAELSPFADAFSKRPTFTALGSKSTKKRFNQGGTGFFHAFYLWVAVRWLKPLHIVESGAFNGMGTYMLRQAAPTAQIIVVTPQTPKLYRDHHADSVYFSGKGFQDFSSINWDCLGLDKARTLLFIDDHQSGYRRMLEAHRRGFTHMLFDDNYPAGDNYSPYRACEETRRRKKLDGTVGYMDFWRRDPVAYLDGASLAKIGDSFARLTETYYEFPLVWKGPSRLMSLQGFHNVTSPPLLTGKAAAAFRARYSSVIRSAEEESRQYTFLPYVRLRSTLVAPPDSLFWPIPNGSDVLPPRTQSCSPGTSSSTSKKPTGIAAAWKRLTALVG